MKTAKLVIGIVSIVISFVVIFQSCAAGLAEAFGDTGGSSGGAGTIVALFLLTAGIVGIATRKTKGGGITSGIFYIVAGLVGITNRGMYGDLKIWSVLAFIFALVYIIGSAKMQKKAAETESFPSDSDTGAI